jgi:ribosome-associated protein
LLIRHYVKYALHFSVGATATAPTLRRSYTGIAETYGASRKGKCHLVRTTALSSRTDGSSAKAAAHAPGSAQLLAQIIQWLDEAKAEDIVTIPLEGKSSLGDYMVIATGRSDRHVGAIADQLHQKIKATGLARVRVEGKEACDWVLIDTGDIIVHVFRPEVREFYNLEKMWKAEIPAGEVQH